MAEDIRKKQVGRNDVADAAKAQRLPEGNGRKKPQELSEGPALDGNALKTAASLLGVSLPSASEPSKRCSEDVEAVANMLSRFKGSQLSKITKHLRAVSRKVESGNVVAICAEAIAQYEDPHVACAVAGQLARLASYSGSAAATADGAKILFEKEVILAISQFKNSEAAAGAAARRICFAVAYDSRKEALSIAKTYRNENVSKALTECGSARTVDKVTDSLNSIAERAKSKRAALSAAKVLSECENPILTEKTAEWLDYISKHVKSRKVLIAASDTLCLYKNEIARESVAGILKILAKETKSEKTLLFAIKSFQNPAFIQALSQYKDDSVVDAIAVQLKSLTTRDASKGAVIATAETFMDLDVVNGLSRSASMCWTVSQVRMIAERTESKEATIASVKVLMRDDLERREEIAEAFRYIVKPKDIERSKREASAMVIAAAHAAMCYRGRVVPVIIRELSHGQRSDSRKFISLAEAYQNEKVVRAISQHRDVDIAGTVSDWFRDIVMNTGSKEAAEAAANVLLEHKNFDMADIIMDKLKIIAERTKSGSAVISTANVYLDQRVIQQLSQYGDPDVAEIVVRLVGMVAGSTKSTEAAVSVMGIISKWKDHEMATVVAKMLSDSLVEVKSQEEATAIANRFSGEDIVRLLKAGVVPTPTVVAAIGAKGAAYCIERFERIKKGEIDLDEKLDIELGYSLTKGRVERQEYMRAMESVRKCNRSSLGSRLFEPFEVKVHKKVIVFTDKMKAELSSIRGALYKSEETLPEVIKLLGKKAAADLAKGMPSAEALRNAALDIQLKHDEDQNLGEQLFVLHLKLALMDDTLRKQCNSRNPAVAIPALHQLFFDRMAETKIGLLKDIGRMVALMSIHGGKLKAAGEKLELCADFDELDKRYNAVIDKVSADRDRIRAVLAAEADSKKKGELSKEIGSLNKRIALFVSLKKELHSSNHVTERLSRQIDSLAREVERKNTEAFDTFTFDPTKSVVDIFSGSVSSDCTAGRSTEFFRQFLTPNAWNVKVYSNGDWIGNVYLLVSAGGEWVIDAIQIPHDNWDMQQLFEGLTAQLSAAARKAGATGFYLSTFRSNHPHVRGIAVGMRSKQVDIRFASGQRIFTCTGSSDFYPLIKSAMETPIAELASQLKTVGAFSSVFGFGAAVADRCVELENRLRTLSKRSAVRRYFSHFSMLDSALTPDELMRVMGMLPQLERDIADIEKKHSAKLERLARELVSLYFGKNITESLSGVVKMGTPQEMDKGADKKTGADASAEKKKETNDADEKKDKGQDSGTDTVRKQQLDQLAERLRFSDYIKHGPAAFGEEVLLRFAKMSGTLSEIDPRLYDMYRLQSTMYQLSHFLRAMDLQFNLTSPIGHGTGTGGGMPMPGPRRILVGQAQIRTEQAPEWAVPKSSIFVHFTSFLTYLHELAEASAEVAHPTFFKLLLDLPEEERKYVISRKDTEEDCYSYMYGPVVYDYFERLVQIKKAEKRRFERMTNGIGQTPKTEPAMDTAQLPSAELMEARRKAMRLFSNLLDLPLQTVIGIMNRAAEAKTAAERMAILAELDRAIGLSKKMDALGGNGQ